MSNARRKNLYLVDAKDKETVLKVGNSDLLLWEKQGNSAADLQDEEKALEAQFSFAHAVAVRRKVFTGSLEEFIDTYDVFGDEEEPANDPKGSK